MGTQHFLVTHSVNNTTGVAARWYEFRAQGLGTTRLSLYQSGQTPDDGEYRWMGSVAMDKSGDIALGYSRSSGAAGDFPSIYYAGQTAGDPRGTTEAEALIKQGTGSQPDTVIAGATTRAWLSMPGTLARSGTRTSTTIRT